jgi:hypothetical protein
MDEHTAKETLNKESEKTYSPLSSHDISGWVDDKNSSNLLQKQNKKKFRFNLHSSIKKQTTLKPISKIKKPFSLYEFFSINNTRVLYTNPSKNKTNNPKRPSTSIQKQQANKNKQKFTSILLNNFLNPKDTNLTNKYLPRKLSISNNIRKSSLSLEDHRIKLKSSLVIYGSTCTVRS